MQTIKSRLNLEEIKGQHSSKSCILSYFTIIFIHFYLSSIKQMKTDTHKPTFTQIEKASTKQEQSCVQFRNKHQHSKSKFAQCQKFTKIPRVGKIFTQVYFLWICPICLFSRKAKPKPNRNFIPRFHPRLEQITSIWLRNEPGNWVVPWQIDQSFCSMRAIAGAIIYEPSIACALIHQAERRCRVEMVPAKMPGKNTEWPQRLWVLLTSCPAIMPAKRGFGRSHASTEELFYGSGFTGRWNFSLMRGTRSVKVIRSTINSPSGDNDLMKRVTAIPKCSDLAGNEDWS